MAQCHHKELIQSIFRRFTMTLTVPTTSCNLINNVIFIVFFISTCRRWMERWIFPCIEPKMHRHTYLPPNDVIKGIDSLRNSFTSVSVFDCGRRIRVPHTLHCNPKKVEEEKIHKIKIHNESAILLCLCLSVRMNEFSNYLYSMKKYYTAVSPSAQLEWIK